MAAAFNVWGRDAVRNGFRYFFFHNHDVEFTLVDGRPLFDILLEETDPRYVKFEIDLGWLEVSGQSAYEYIRRDPSRFPMFHVKDIRWDPNGPRVAAAGTANAGRRFFFTDLGKGVIDWPKIFSALRDPGRHHYFVEHDDAGDDETVDATSPRPRNPAGSANTAWTGRKYLANLEIPRRRAGRDEQQSPVNRGQTAASADAGARPCGRTGRAPQSGLAAYRGLRSDSRQGHRAETRESSGSTGAEMLRVTAYVPARRDRRDTAPLRATT